MFFWNRLDILLGLAAGPGPLEVRTAIAAHIAEIVAMIWNRPICPPVHTRRDRQFWIMPAPNRNGSRPEYLGLVITVCDSCGRVTFQARFGDQLIDPDLPRGQVRAFVKGDYLPAPRPFIKPRCH